MTTHSPARRRGRFTALVGAEFRKVWASRIPLAFLVTIPILVYAFVYELYNVEQMTSHLRVRQPWDTLAVLHFATWKSLLFQAAVVAFSAFWSTLDSQYGMIRVTCTQPISRMEYLAAKWCGILGHVVLFATVLVVAEVAWTLLYSGAANLDSAAWMTLARFALETICLSSALAGISMAVASCRRTVGAGLVTAFMAFIGLAFMTMLPFDVLAPRFVFMRYFFFALGELPNPLPGDSPFVRVHSLADFALIVTATPALVSLPAVVYFSRRDITE